ATQSQLKPNQWHHLFVTYDGSGKAAGLKIYVNGVPQATTVQADSLKDSIRARVPFKLAQRHAGSRIDNLLLQDVRVYSRALPGPDVDRLAKTTRAAWLAAKAADKRSAGEKDELFAWWLSAMDAPYQALAGKLDSLQQEEAAIKSRGTVAHVMQERPE